MEEHTRFPLTWTLALAPKLTLTLNMTLVSLALESALILALPPALTLSLNMTLVSPALESALILALPLVGLVGLEQLFQLVEFIFCNLLDINGNVNFPGFGRAVLFDWCNIVDEQFSFPTVFARHFAFEKKHSVG